MSAGAISMAVAPGKTALTSLFPKGGYTITRTDAGQDFGVARGKPIGAVSPGSIAAVQQYGPSGNPNDFGTTIFEKLASPVDGFSYIYYALEGGASAYKDTVGRTLGGSEQIATGLGAGGVEIGFATEPSAAGIEQDGSAAGNQVPGGIKFAKSIGLVPHGPEEPATYGNSASNPYTGEHGPSTAQQAVSAVSGIPGEVAEGLIGDITPVASKLSIYAILVIGGIGLVLYGIVKALQPATGISPAHLASKGAAIGAEAA